ncbi:MAG: hypothetical protein ACJ77X_04750 [Chloroflexota bacterium]
MAAGFPERDRRLKRHALASLGLLAECSLSVPGTCLALEQIEARDWASSGGWGSYADGSMRRGWFRHRQRTATVFALELITLFGSTDAGEGDVDRRDAGWLNIIVLPAVARPGSSIEISADLDAEMYASVRSAVRGLFVRIVRVSDSTVR